MSARFFAPIDACCACGGCRALPAGAEGLPARMDVDVGWVAGDLGPAAPAGIAVAAGPSARSPTAAARGGGESPAPARDGAGPMGGAAAAVHVRVIGRRAPG